MISSQRKVGILGGGQLALMLANAAVRMGLKPIALAENSSAPVARIHTDTIFGSPENENDLRCLLSQVEFVIFENEFVNCEKIQKIAEEEKVPFFPELTVIATLQDKLNQKKLLEKLSIPTSEYCQLELSQPISEKALSDQMLEISKKLGDRFVLKWARMGYDGKGVLVVGTEPLNLERIRIFLEDAGQLNSPVYAEKWIPFQRELAVVGVYSTRGEFFSYPLVISEQQNGICHRVYGPAELCGVSAQDVALAQKYVRQVAEEVNLTGSFAIEFFQTQDGKLIVNEIAPRVHNSGHYTQNACPADQFENHWRAVLGIPLGRGHHQPGFAMLNVLGPATLRPFRNVVPQSMARTHVHWYGKETIRAGRKLGHINGSINSIDQMKSLLIELDQCHDHWVKQLDQTTEASN